MSNFKYIEEGWNSYRQIILPADTPGAQLAEIRQGYYSGAAVLFQTLMLSLDTDEEPTEADMQRMASLQAEIDEFGLELDLRLLPVGGHG